MNFDIYQMVQQVERDNIDQRLRRAADIPRMPAPARRHPLVAGLGRGLTRLGESLQGIPARPVLDLAAGQAPERAAG